MNIEVAEFIGPLGGLLCIAWAMGSISGYAFHSKTIHKMHKENCQERIDELEKECAQLRARVELMEERLRGQINATINRRHRERPDRSPRRGVREPPK